MKKLLILLFSILISINSYGEWTEVSRSLDGVDTYYIEHDTIKEHGGYVYYWMMIDSLEPWEGSGYLSDQTYNQGDCGIYRNKILSYIFYKRSMGKGTGKSDNTPSEWRYPSSGTVGKGILDYVCDYVK